MNRKVYFGNAQSQCWIPAPLTGLRVDSAGFSVENQLLSGRTHVKRSGANHRAFSVSWNGSLNAETREDSLHTIKDYGDGIYGEGPFYWLDPYAVDTNLLPPHWASPMLSLGDWPSISSVGTQSLISTASNTKNYPYQSLKLAFSGVAESTTYQRILIPEGYKLHFGVHGVLTSGSATVSLRQYPRAGGSAVVVNAAILANNSAIRTNTQVNGNTYSMVDVFIRNTVASASDLRISGMIAQVLPEADSVPQGEFWSGRGTSALEFTQLPNVEYYSAAINNGQVGMSANFKEV
jgi:hypothetical protein